MNGNDSVASTADSQPEPDSTVPLRGASTAVAASFDATCGKRLLGEKTVYKQSDLHRSHIARSGETRGTPRWHAQTAPDVVGRGAQVLAGRAWFSL
jgi:hypothetical protein